MSAKEAEKAFNKQKLELADRIRRDGALTGSIRTIGAELCSLANFKTGYAWASEKYLNEQLGVGERTVKRAVAALKAAGYFEVIKAGRNNRYRPVFQEQQGSIWPLSEKEQGPNWPLSHENRGQKGDQQGPKSTENRGQNVPPISLRTSLGISSGAPARDGEESAVAPDTPIERTIGSALRRRLGDDVFAAWLGKLTVASTAGGELVLIAPTKFIADRVRADFGELILESYGAPDAVLRIEVAKPPQAAPIPSIGERRSAADPDAAWLLEHGVKLVSNHLRVGAHVADRTIVDWLKRAGRDTGALRRILTEAAAQRLFNEQFENVVKERTRALRHEGQRALPLAPVAISRRFG